MNRKRLNLDHFAGRADEAAFWEAWVGAVLARCGLYTLHHPFTVAKHPGEVAQYGHTWDLDVSATGHFDYVGDYNSVEVKSVNLTFSGPQDYPYDQCLVCSQNSFLRKWPGKDTIQRDFLIVSRYTGSIVCIPVGTKVELGVEVYDMDRGEDYKGVRTPKENLRDLQTFIQAVKARGG